jgi:hypothetical protein
MCVTIPSWCRIQRMSLRLVYMNSRPCHIIWFCRCSYKCIRIQLKVSPSLFTYLEKSICFIIPFWCRIHCTSLGLIYINTGSCHVSWFYCCSYSSISNQYNVSPSLFTCLDKSICRIIPSWCRIHRISLALVYITTRSCHIILFYHCSYTGMSTQFTVSPSLYHISRQFDVRYNLLVVPYINAFHYD